MEAMINNNDYNQFDSDLYYKTFYSDSILRTDTHRAKGVLAFLLDTLSSIYNSGQLNGGTLLDFGTGPTIHNLISAAPHFNNIYLSDFSENNRNALWRWLNKQPGYADFSHFFKYVNTKEGATCRWEDREHEMRNKIRGILKCDMTRDNPLSPSMFPQFDVISSSLCLEVVPSVDMSSYETAVKNVASLCKPGGWVVLIGDINGSFYRFGQFKFDVVALSPADVKRIWGNAGFTVDVWKQFDQTEAPEGVVDQEPDDQTAIFCMTARKKI